MHVKQPQQEGHRKAAHHDYGSHHRARTGSNAFHGDIKSQKSAARVLAEIRKQGR